MLRLVLAVVFVSTLVLSGCGDTEVVNNTIPRGTTAPAADAPVVDKAFVTE